MISRLLVLLVVSMLMAVPAASAQDSLRVADDETNILFKNEASGGVTFHSSGLGISFRRGWHLTGYRKQMLDIDFVSLRHPKQYKQPNPYYQDSRPFFFGKLNFVLDRDLTNRFISEMKKGYHMGWLTNNVQIFKSYGDVCYDQIIREETPQAERMAGIVKLLSEEGAL